MTLRFIFRSMVVVLMLAPVWMNAQVLHFKMTDEGYGPAEFTALPSYTQTQTLNTLQIDYVFPGFSKYDMVADDGNAYQLIRMEGFGVSSEPGLPSLPERLDKVAIPDGMQAMVSVQPGDFVEIPNIILFPAQFVGTDDIVQSTEFTLNSAAYKLDTYLPATASEIVEVQTYREVQLAYLAVHPVQYNAAAKTVRIYKELKITVQFTPKASKSVTTKRKVTSDTEMLKGLVVNYESLTPASSANKSAVVKATKGYLIVTVPAFAEAAAKLAAWKQQMGYTTEIVSQASWTVSQVKSLTTNRYLNAGYNLSYLTLLGDHQQIPDYSYNAKDVTKPNAEDWWIFSTNYYACMNGANDYIPDFAHGRIPVQTAEQAMTVVNKIIGYECNPPSDPTFYRKGLHAGYFQDSTRNGESDKRYAKTTIEMYDYMTARGFQSDLILYTEPNVVPDRFNPYYSGVTTLPSAYKRSNGYAWDGDRYDILNAWNDGRLYAWHRDHGQQWGWMAPEFKVDDVASLHNGNELPIVFSVNCGSGKFDSSEPDKISFAESVLRHPNGGAAGVVAATAVTLSGYNDGLIIGMMDAIWSNPGIIPNLGAEARTPTNPTHDPIYSMGDVLVQGLLRMTETWNQTWASKEQYNLFHYFGDPAMKIWTDVPHAITATYPSQLGVGATSIPVTNVSEEGVTVTACYNGALKRVVEISGGSGTLTLPTPISADVIEVIITFSKHNCIPLVDTILVETAPVSNFTSDKTTICAGETVQFTNLSSDNATTWSWVVTPDSYSFVNSTSASKNPKIVFNGSGSYDVELVASNSWGNSLMVKENFVLVKAIPAAMYDTTVYFCDGETIPELVADGDEVKWYQDSELQHMVSGTSTYQPVMQHSGDTTFYLTRTVNLCTSSPSTFTVHLSPELALPEVTPDTICYNSSVTLQAGQICNWYSDPLKADLIKYASSEYFVSSLSPGDYSYYVAREEDFCESEVVVYPLHVHEQVEAPEVAAAQICQGETLWLSADGLNLRWYNDADKNNFLYEGDRINKGTPELGSHRAYVTQTLNDCESETSTLNFTILPVPEFSLGNDREVLFGDSLRITCTQVGTYEWSNGSESASILIRSPQVSIGTHSLWLKVTSDNTCSYTDSIKVRILEPTGLDGSSEQCTIALYPNPAESVVTLVPDFEVHGVLNIAVRDIQGKLLLTSRYEENEQQEIQLDVSGLMNGVYILAIQNNVRNFTLPLLVRK